MIKYLDKSIFTVYLFVKKKISKTFKKWGKLLVLKGGIAKESSLL